MNELDLYKFVQNKEIDWRGGKDEKLIIWLHPEDLPVFAELLGYDYLSEGGTGVTLLHNGSIGVELNEICEDFDIDPERIHPKEDI